MRTFVGSGSLTVNLYGTPQNRRVESTGEPLRVVGAPQVKRVPDPTLLKGESEVLEYGEPARATSVSRKVYSASGTLLHEDTWYSQYRSEPRVIRVGTKPKPKPKPKKKPPKVDPLLPPRSGRPPERSARVYASALAITSANQAGTRVGRRVVASTIACEVWPSATSVPSRSIAYS